MTEKLPDDIAIIALGPAGAPLGRRLQAALPGSRLHGPCAHPADWDESYERASLHIAGLFEAGRPILGLCASGILIRAVAPLLAAKQVEPPVVAVAEDGSVAVPLGGGHEARPGARRAAAGLADRQSAAGPADNGSAVTRRARGTGRGSGRCGLAPRGGDRLGRTGRTACFRDRPRCRSRDRCPGLPPAGPGIGHWLRAGLLGR